MKIRWVIDKSNRTDILFALIKSHIKDGIFILDIGCGSPRHRWGNCLPEQIHGNFGNIEYLGIDIDEEVIEFCKEVRSFYKWLYGDVTKLVIDRRYGLVIHVGFNGWWSNIWKTHLNLTKRKNFKPPLVFLEAGTPLDSNSEHKEVFDMVKNRIYLKAGYRIIQEGTYLWDAKDMRNIKRYFVILKS